MIGFFQFAVWLCHRYECSSIADAWLLIPGQTGEDNRKCRYGKGVSKYEFASLFSSNEGIFGVCRGYPRVGLRMVLKENRAINVATKLPARVTPAKEMNNGGSV